MNRKRSLLTFGAAAATALAAAGPASAATFTVDDDRADCPDAEFQQIQPAEAAAAPGDTIRVCRGVYEGKVQVTKPLTLLGAHRGNGAAPSRDDVSKESVVINDGDGGFDVFASDVTIDGFTVQGDPTATDYPNAGIYLRTGAGREITDNVLRENGLGTYLEGAQSETEIERNAYLANRRVPSTGQPTGGIFAAGGQLNEVEIEDNEFRGNAQFSVNVGDGSSGGLSIAHNTGEDEGTFVVIGRTAGAVIEHNRVEDLRGSGVFSFGANTDLRIAYNELTGREGPDNGSGVRSTINFGAGPSSGLVVEHNRFGDFSFAGVSLNADTGATVRFNDLENNLQNGVLLQNADNSLVARNRARDNGRGLRAEAQSTGNTIEDNDLRGNLTLDCSDASVGPGTSGTANFWLDNKGNTQDRPGICRPTGRGK
jgi:parallel beta-helix repeat protein